MLSLLRFEFRKLFRKKSFYIFLGIQFGYLLLQSLIIYGIIRLFGITGEDAELLESMGILAASTGVKSMMGALGQMSTTLLIAIFITIFACEDRSSDVLKNIYSRGYTSDEVFGAEFITVCVFCAIFSVASWIYAFLIGTAMFGVGSGFDGNAFGMMLGQLLVIFAFASVYFMFAKLIQKMGGTLPVNIILTVLVPSIFSGIDMFCSFSAMENGTEPIVTSKYILSGAITTLSNTASSGKDIAIAISLAVAYLAVFIAGGIFINKKRPA